jgi:hypothetical protein
MKTSFLILTILVSIFVMLGTVGGAFGLPASTEIFLFSIAFATAGLCLYGIFDRESAA